jgi:hypothetical protein
VDHGLAETDNSFLFLFFKKESAFFFEKNKQKTFPVGVSPASLAP